MHIVSKGRSRAILAPVVGNNSDPRLRCLHW
ncbi:hypothetical protein AZE42_11306 [Rhizopogon vesiculosus]|uniref:Uncharacterized protein n=1 Tax=Rhizopogon vesiculosus TaxID=180088 RepID=A0A1J8QLM6_9AGAM|nr:hypothetical protein AZE42_11306 [Rhizopogon vesiculosus]